MVLDMIEHLTPLDLKKSSNSLKPSIEEGFHPSLAISQRVVKSTSTSKPKDVRRYLKRSSSRTSNKVLRW